jgi:hypothetical protein
LNQKFADSEKWLDWYSWTEECEFGSRICKPNFVLGIAPAGRPFLWAAHY